MIRICMAGARGRMGRRILELAAGDPAFDIGGVFDLPAHAGEQIRVGAESGQAIDLTLAPSAQDALAEADVLIDFTRADACLPNVEAAGEAGKAVVVGTTGLSTDQVERLRMIAAHVPIVYAPNMSLGVNLLFKLTEQTAKALGLDFNIEITEIHHNKKNDSPSGTAVRLAERAAEANGLRYPDDAAFGREGMVGERPQREIGVHALRGGDVVGEHTVAFIGQGERIELTHKAHSRDTFARGALAAARYAAEAQPGLYDMQDVLGLK